MLELGFAFPALLQASDVDCREIAMQFPQDLVRAARGAALANGLLQLLFRLLEVGLGVVLLHRLRSQLACGLVLRCGERSARYEQSGGRNESIQSDGENAKF